MKKIIALSLIMLLAIQTNSAPTCKVGDAAATTGFDGYYNSPLGVTGRTCVAAGGNCATNYASNSAGSTATAGTSAAGADCDFCATDLFFSAPSSVTGRKCVAAGESCETNTASGSAAGANTAGTGTTGANCDFCATNFFFSAPSGIARGCVAAGAACLSGYVSDSTANTATAGSADTGADCSFCAAGYTDSDTGDAPSSAVTVCNKCRTMTKYYWNAPSGEDGRMCSKTCKSGFTDKTSGETPTSPDLSGNCNTALSTGADAKTCNVENNSATDGTKDGYWDSPEGTDSRTCVVPSGSCKEGFKDKADKKTPITSDCTTS